MSSLLLSMSSSLPSFRAVARMDGYQELTNRLQLHLNRQFQLQLQVGWIGWKIWPNIDALPAKRYSLYFLLVALFYFYFDISWALSYNIFFLSLLFYTLKLSSLFGFVLNIFLYPTNSSGELINNFLIGF